MGEFHSIRSNTKEGNGIKMSFKCGIDVGGTFTDLVIIDTEKGELFAGKTLTSPTDPSIGVVKGIDELFKLYELDPHLLNILIHGTTLVTNAIIEKKGAKIGLITTKGFKDVLEIGREKRYDIYNLFLEIPEPLVPRYLRKEVEERVDSSGNIICKLNISEAKNVVKELIKQGAKGIAICFLHSYNNSKNEKEMESIIEDISPTTVVSCSSDVFPEIREYERTSTVVANVYTRPLTESYLERIESEFCKREIKANLYVMLSHGGAATPETAKRFPIRLLESGPAAGALGASYYAKVLKEDKVVSFDMGGTTAKICLIDGAKPLTTREFEAARIYRFKKGSGLPIKIPVIEMIEIGAGGGSIAWINKMGIPQVGPKSAGAEPGPVCYDRGGKELTVTDADLVLGYLDPDYFLGGRMKLNIKKTKEVLKEKFATPLNISLTEAAWGVCQIVNQNMINSGKVYAAEKGKDLREYTLIAFGGAGPIHACSLAQNLGIRKVIVPSNSGVASALGLLTAPLSFDFIHSYVSPLKEVNWSVLNKIFKEMKTEGVKLLKKVGIRDKEIYIKRSFDMRYIGQAHEVEVSVPNNYLTYKEVNLISRSFEKAYEILYGKVRPNVEVEIINCRSCVSGPEPTLKLGMNISIKGIRLKGKRKVFFPENKDYVLCNVYNRYALSPGIELSGPCVVEEKESTIVIPPSAHAYVDKYLNILINLIN